MKDPQTFQDLIDDANERGDWQTAHALEAEFSEWLDATGHSIQVTDEPQPELTGDEISEALQIGVRIPQEVGAQ